MFKSTKIIELGSCAFRQPTATSHCKFLHGYRLTAKFWFEADSLDQNNWVVDFGGLKDLKKILQVQFDHTTCISRLDPKLDEFKRLEQAGVCDLRIMDGVGIEKFAEWCWVTANKHVMKITDDRCRCIKVEVFEHENNSAIYEKQVVAVESIDSIENDAATNDFMGNKHQPVTKSTTVTTKTNKINNVDGTNNKRGVPVSTNKIKNKWVDPESTNVWGL